MIIKVKNKGFLCLLIIAALLFLAQLHNIGFLSGISEIGELTLFLIILWILSLFIKLEVEE